jgi:glycyl-tRNA synthetase
LHPALSAFKAAIFPLTKKLREPAMALFKDLSYYINVDYDEAGSIGKRYRRHDEIGTPFCITYDFDSLEDQCVTVRFRDSMEQKRVKIEELTHFILEQLKF